MNNRFENLGISKVHLSFVLYITAIVLLSIPRGNAQVQLDVRGDGIISGSLGIGLPAPQLKLSIKGSGIVDTRTAVLGIMSNISQRPSIQFSENNNIYGGMSIEYDGTGYGASNKLVLNAVDGSPLFTLFNDGNISVTGKISYVDDPVDTQDAATKAYVDNLLLSFGVSIGSSGIQGLLNAGFSPSVIINNGAPLTDFIGLNHAGGIIFYMDPSGNGQGLVAAEMDQSTGAQWGCYGIPISGADRTAIGTGNQNTIDIETGCTTSGTAADICANLSLNGFTDWFLPSRDELNEMYLKIGQAATGANQNIGGFADSFYWSSSEFADNLAWRQRFIDGVQNVDVKGNFGHVRAIRAF